MKKKKHCSKCGGHVRHMLSCPKLDLALEAVYIIEQRKKRRAKKYQPFIRSLIDIKNEAGRLGLFVTMHAIDKATKAVGYEVADIVTNGRKKR